MNKAGEKATLQILADYQAATNWHPELEVPCFVKNHEVVEGPFLNRGNRLLAISERTAWALLNKQFAVRGGRLGTYSEREPTAKDIRGLSDFIRL